MILNHAAIMCSSEEKAEMFYKGIFEMEKIKEFIVQKDLAKRVFSIDKELKAIVYSRNKARIEIFIIENVQVMRSHLPHLCIEVEDREDLIKKCMQKKAEVIKIPKEDSYFLFIRDFDGNLFEIKQSV